MKKGTKILIEKLAEKIVHFPQPIHLLAVCTGGITMAKFIQIYLQNKNIDAEYYEIWTNIIDGKRTIERSSFTKKNYKGTAVIVEDVIWQGGALPPIKKMLKNLNPKKRVYVISLFDCNRKADYAIFY